ncbi:MAG: hypothetical protein SNJ29_07200 [Rikenellaceae bacterium]
MEDVTNVDALNEEQVNNEVEQTVAATEDESTASTDESAATIEDEGTSTEPTADAESIGPIKAEKKTSSRKSKVSKAKAKSTIGEDAVPADDNATAEVETATKSKKELKAEAHVERCQEIAKEYKKLYPTVTEFHITPDYQVFLGENKSAAESHAVKRGGKIQTIKFD